MEHNFDLLYQKLSEEGKKRVDSYAKFILTEEEYADDVKNIAGLINEFREGTVWSSVELGNLNRNEIDEINATTGYFLTRMDIANPYRVTLERIVQHCNSYFYGDLARSANIIAELKDLEHSIET